MKNRGRRGHRITLRLALLGLIVAAAGCNETGDPEGPRGLPTEPTTLMDLTGPPLAKCRNLRLVRVACPVVVPKTAQKYTGRRIPFDRRFGTFELTSSAAYEGEPERNRPPRFAHIVVEAGDLARRFEFDWPPPPADREPGELLTELREEPALLGRPEWGGRQGMLVLMPPFELGGIHGDHLLFQWRDRGVDYLLSLHAWEPLEESRATLRAIVESLPAA